MSGYGIIVEETGDGEGELVYQLDGKRDRGIEWEERQRD